MNRTSGKFSLHQLTFILLSQLHQQSLGHAGTQTSGYVTFPMSSHFGTCLLPGVGNGWQNGPQRLTGTQQPSQGYSSSQIAYGLLLGFGIEMLQILTRGVGGVQQHPNGQLILGILQHKLGLKQTFGSQESGKQLGFEQLKSWQLLQFMFVDLIFIFHWRIWEPALTSWVIEYEWKLSENMFRCWLQFDFFENFFVMNENEIERSDAISWWVLCKDSNCNTQLYMGKRRCIHMEVHLSLVFAVDYMENLAHKDLSQVDNSVCTKRHNSKGKLVIDKTFFWVFNFR